MPITNQPQSAEYVFNGINTGYIIDTSGNIFSLKSDRIIHPWKNNGGYLYFSIFVDGKNQNIAVHRAVAEMFIPNPENKPQVNHIDGNKMNNNVSNLQWVTQSENNYHAYATHLHPPLSAEKSTFTKYTNSQIENACSLMEKNKHTLNEIAMITGVPSKTLSEIRSGKIWKSISKNYDFPEKAIRDSKTKDFTYTQKQELIKLAQTDMSIKEIAAKLNVNLTHSVYGTIYWHKYYKQGLTKVQRPSKDNQID